MISYIFPIFLMLYEFALYMSNDMYTPAFPAIANTFLVTEEFVQYTLSAWLLGGAIAQVILGPLSDLYGRRTVLFYGGLLFLLSCLVCVYTNIIEIFMMARFFQGIGVCSMMIAGYACIHETYQDKEAVSILALMSGLSVTAPMIGPLIGGYVVSLYDWRTIFSVIFWMAALCLIGLYFFMPKNKVKAPSLSFDFKKMAKDYWFLLKNKKFIGYCFSFGLFYSALMLWIVASPFLLMTDNGISPKLFGLLQIPIFGAFILATQVVRKLGDRLNFNQFIKMGAWLALLSIMILCCFLYYKNTIFFLILGMAIYAFGFGLLSAPLNRLAFNTASGEKGITASVFYTSMMGTGSFITILFGIFYTGYISYLITMSAIILLGLFKFKNCLKI